MSRVITRRAIALSLFLVPAAALAETVQATLEGPQEVPSNLTVARGSFVAKIDEKARTIEYTLSYEGLQGDVTQAHIHVAQAGVNGGISVWLCATDATRANVPPTAPSPPECPASGTVQGVAEVASVVGPAGQLVSPQDFDRLVRAIREGVTYANVHSTVLTGGEIRGQIK
jgi:hypothetical protein